MTTIQFKACPRCKGDLILEEEDYGPEWVCLQCGYREKEKPRRLKCDGACAYSVRGYLITMVVLTACLRQTGLPP